MYSTAKHRRVAESIRRKILAGGLRAGDRLGTYQELQVQYGVAINTVGRALVDLESDGLVRREPGRGVFVASTIQRRGIIAAAGFDTSDVQTGYWASLLSGCHSEAAASRVEMLLLHQNSDLSTEKMDGLLVHSDTADLILSQRPAGMPAVAMMIPAVGVPSVAADDFQAGFAATRHLTDLGHRRIGWVGSLIGPLIQRRIAGYRWALSRVHTVPEPEWLYETNTAIFTPSLFDTARLTMLRWLEERKPGVSCTALLAQNDVYAFGILAACREMGVKVPEEISVVGFDGIAETERSVPTLTTVDIPLVEIGARATSTLVRMLRGEAVEPLTTLLPTKLHIRESTGPAPA